MAIDSNTPDETPRLTDGEQERLATRPAEFLITATRDTHIWIQVMQGADQGIRVSVPIRHPDYSDDLENTISELQRSMFLTATLVSDETDSPNWRINEILEIDDR